MMTISDYSIIKKVLTVLPFYLFTFLPLSAQTFTQRLQQQQPGQGSVTINQDPAIDQLVNSEMLGKVSDGNKTTKTSANTNNSANNTKNSVNNTAKNTSKATNGQSSTTEEADNQQEEDVDTSKKMIRGGHKVTGYRVQAFAGGNSRKDRIQAEQTGNSIKAQFANVPVYVHFYSPRWICRVGNYRTYEEAHQMLVQLRNLGYNQASIVKGKITVHY